MGPKQKWQIMTVAYGVISAICLVFLPNLIEFDIKLASILVSYSTPVLDSLFLAITYMGSTMFWGLMVVILWLAKDRKTSTYLFIGLIIDVILIIFLKYSLNRTRPNLGPITEVTPSFPSAHTSKAFLGASLIKYHQPVLILLAVLVGFSRMYLGVHYFTDVLFGAMIGSYIALNVKFLPEKKIERFLAKISKKL